MLLVDNYFDIAVIGAGPAGCAAAIHAALKGLRVIMLESHAKPRLRPGESLPPGVEVIFRQLGVWRSIDKMNFIRYSGHYIYMEELKKSIFQFYGQDKNGPWQGIQIPRMTLDTLLQQRAEKVGVKLVRKCHVKNIITKNGNISLVAHNNELIQAKNYIDATGHTHLFARKFGIPMTLYSTKLIAKYGYLQNDCPYKNLPIFINNVDRWSWYAEIDNNLYAWVKVEKNNIDHCPKKYSAARGADVTWRMAKQVAKSGCFLVGDAACVLDPSAGKGVLRALMTGIMASQIIFHIIKNNLPETAAYQYYHNWLTTWFMQDMQILKKIF